jgi:tRNA G18 (ribose-2'-O)-methylase SpoU
MKHHPPAMRGFFGMGVQGISKEMNVGNLMRSAHAFGASFFFHLAPAVNVRKLQRSDTAKSARHMPVYAFDTADDLIFPRHTQLVGVELTDGAHELPSFHHPLNAAYILGPERGSLSDQVIDQCDHLIQIPAKFCVNVGVAGAIVMYDRLISKGKFAPRPVSAGGPVEQVAEHVFGGPIIRNPDRGDYSFGDE